MVNNGQSEQSASMKNVTGMNSIHTLSNTSSKTPSHQENVKGGPQSVKGGGGKTGSFAHIFKGAMKKGEGWLNHHVIKQFIQHQENIIIHENKYTPTKRKLITEGNIQKLIGIFDSTTRSKSSNESGISESPAKRGRWGPWGD